VPFLVIGNIRTGCIDFQGCRRVTHQYYEALDDIHRPRRGDLLYSLVGSYGIPVVVHDEPPFCVQRHIGIIRPSAHMSVDYLAHVLRSSVVFAQATDIATGIAQKTVPLTGLRNVLIPVPPLAEQHRIAAKVDELMAVCERLEAAQDERERRRERLSVGSLARLTAPAETPGRAAKKDVTFFLSHAGRMVMSPAHIADLRRSILDLAVQGRLVQQLPIEDPLEDSLRSINDSADLSRRNGILPASWVPSRMSLVTTVITSGSRGWAQYYAKTGAIFVRSQNVKSGTLDLHDLARVSLPNAAEGKRTKLEPGDLLIVITGDVGHVGAWETDRGEAYISQHIALARPVRTELTPWMLLCLRAPAAGNGQLRAGIYGGKPGLNLQQVGRVSLPLPPLPEQRRIVAKVDELMSMCDELERSLEALEEGRARALKAVLHGVLEEAGAPLSALLEVTG
jgi:type I restriction enzyme S subunit